MITYHDFIGGFPEFSDRSKYPVAQINFWIPQAYNQLSEKRFRKSLGLAVMLFVAHNIVLSARAAEDARDGQVVGDAIGLLTAKSIDKLSVSYDVAQAANDGAGAWNSTSYGQRLYTMMKAFGAGPIYVPGHSTHRLW